VVRAYAWRMTVERLLRILISAIRKQDFFKRLGAHQLPMRAQRVGGELVLVGGQQPIGTDTGRSATNSKSSGCPVTEHEGGYRIDNVRMREAGQPPDREIGLLARLDRADLVVPAEQPGAAERGFPARPGR